MLSLEIRASLMLKASLLSDAAAMPLHWIYDQNKILEKFSNRVDVDSSFYSTPSCPYYSYPLGVYSPYGDESVPIMRSFASVGAYDHDQVAQNMFAFFSVYPDVDEEKDYAGRVSHIPKLFVEARNAGKPWNECNFDDFQATGIAKVPLVVARYAGSEELVPNIVSLVRVLQNNKLSVECSVLVGKLLERILLHSETPAEALRNLPADSQLNEFQKNLLHFASSDELLRKWITLIDALNAVDASKVPKIKSKLLLHYLNHHGDSLPKAIETVVLDSAEENNLLSTVHRQCLVEAGETELSPMKVAKAIGMSCALPGNLIHLDYIYL